MFDVLPRLGILEKHYSLKEYLDLGTNFYDKKPKAKKNLDFCIKHEFNNKNLKDK